jgi:hypothetical protein
MSCVVDVHALSLQSSRFVVAFAPDGRLPLLLIPRVRDPVLVWRRPGINRVSRLLTHQMGSADPRDVGITVLGRLRYGGAELRLGRRDRVVLSVLAMRPGQVISAGRLADAV